MSEEYQTEFEGAYAAGRKFQHGLGEVYRVGDRGKPFLIGEDGSIVDMSGFLEMPERIDKAIAFQDVASFCAYVNEFKEEESKIFGWVTPNNAYFKAILDYHAPGRAQWGLHIAEYTFPETPEWLLIRNTSGQQMKQEKFAEFVERLRIVFKKPDAATMLELARTLEGKTEGTFKSSFNSHNGDRELIYTSATTASGGRTEKLMVPTELEFHIQPFVRGVHFTFPALFRYRVREGNVTFEYELIRPHDYILHAVDQVAAKLKEETGIQPLFGNA